MSEKPDLYMVRRGAFLVPASPMDGDAIEQLPKGVRLKVKVTQPRNVGRHRLYWAALQLVRDNLDSPPSLDSLHAAVKVKLGYSTPIRFKSGAVVQVPASVAFDKMTEAEHREFFDRFSDFVRSELIPGLNKAAFEREAMAMLGEAA